MEMDNNSLVYEFDGGEEFKNIYDEACYIRAYGNTILKKPQKKAHSILATYMGIILYGVGMVVIGLLLLLFNILKIAPIVMITMGGIIICIFLKFYLSYRKYIYTSMMNKVHKKYTITKERITFKDPEKEFSTEWDNINYVVINKYTVSFLPNHINGVVYVLPVEKVDEIQNYMKMIGRDNLIIDNR